MSNTNQQSSIAWKIATIILPVAISIGAIIDYINDTRNFFNKNSLHEILALSYTILTVAWVCVIIVAGFYYFRYKPGSFSWLALSALISGSLVIALLWANLNLTGHKAHPSNSAPPTPPTTDPSACTAPAASIEHPPSGPLLHRGGPDLEGKVQVPLSVTGSIKGMSCKWETIWVFVRPVATQGDGNYFQQHGPCIVEQDSKFECSEVGIQDLPGTQFSIQIYLLNSAQTRAAVRTWVDGAVIDEKEKEGVLTNAHDPQVSPLTPPGIRLHEVLVVVQ